MKTDKLELYKMVTYICSYKCPIQAECQGYAINTINGIPGFF